MSLVRKGSYILILGLLVLSFLGGWWMNHSTSPTENTTTDIQITLSTMKQVAKMATVELNVSEILSHEKFIGYDWDIFKGKVIYKIKGNVVAGYNIDKLEFKVDSLNKIVYFTQDLEPEILFIESDISYYDIQEGLFFSFEKEDYNKVQNLGKEAILESAMSSDILSRAKERYEELFDTFVSNLKAAGWEVKIRPEIIMPKHLKE